MKQKEIAIFKDIYEFGNYLCSTNFNNEKKEFLNKIDLLYKKYLTLEYPVIKYNEEASELYIIYYINNYINNKINEDVFWDYLKKLGIVLKYDFDLFLNEEICFLQVNNFIVNLFEKYKFIYKLARDNNLVVLLHNRVNFNYKGSFSIEPYGSIRCSVINIYQNNSNIDYIFVLAHEIGHFIYEFCEKEVKGIFIVDIEALDKERIADYIAMVILIELGYKIDNSCIMDEHFSKFKEMNDFLKKDNGKC